MKNIHVLASIAATAALAAPLEEIPERIRGAFFGALVADALCLGSHYEYDAPTIKQAYGGKAPERYLAPGEWLGGSTHGVGWGRRNYHPGQKAGDQTDYGQYNLLMLEFFAKEKSSAAVDLEKLIPFWKNGLEADSWGAWRCTQTKQTLQQVRAKAPTRSLGGMSNAMAVRSASVFGVYASEKAAAKASRALLFTHRNGEALAGTEFFTRAAHKIVFRGLKPAAAIRATCDQMGAHGATSRTGRFVREQCDKGFKKFEEVSKAGSALAAEEFSDDLAMTSMARLWEVGKTEPIKVGKASPTEGVMPSCIYMILRYENDPIAAYQANAMVGGDNASRAVAIGMVLGAYHGIQSVPGPFQSGLNAWKKSEKLLKKLPLLQPSALDNIMLDPEASADVGDLDDDL
ncbi:unnamed protein product [Amoebophrya sp. A25]|nr:unnamed protein product [Amoebophrya sp. A25]|eukprot:GSA25T00012020001.1